MKVLFFSDIHGIDVNLEYIKNLDKKEKFDKIVVLGDLYYHGGAYDYSTSYNGMKVKAFLTDYQDRLICLKGNCDSDVDIKSSDFPICNNLALLCIDGIDIYCTHGNEFNMQKNQKFKRKGVLVYGHEHFPYIKKIKSMTFINVGSISLPRNHSEASYGIYFDHKFMIYGISGNIIEKTNL